MILAGIFSYFASSGKWNLCPLKTTAWGGWQSLIAAHLPPNVPGLWEGSLEWGHDTGVWMVREATHAGPGWRKQFLSPLWVKALEGTDFYSHAPRGKQVGYFSACATSPEREKQTEEEAERLQMHNVSKCELCSSGWWGNWTAHTLKERKKKQNINLLKSHNNCQMECVCLKKLFYHVILTLRRENPGVSVLLAMLALPTPVTYSSHRHSPPLTVCRGTWPTLARAFSLWNVSSSNVNVLLFFVLICHMDIWMVTVYIFDSSRNICGLLARRLTG